MAFDNLHLAYQIRKELERVDPAARSASPWPPEPGAKPERYGTVAWRRRCSQRRASNGCALLKTDVSNTATALSLD